MYIFKGCELCCELPPNVQLKKKKMETKVLLGEKFVLALYGSQRFATLDEYMYNAHNRNIASKSMGVTFTLAALPPTSVAA